MCGIAGIVSVSERVDRANIDGMLGTLRHRGPDDEGVYLGSQVALGHRRLSIIDLSPLGHQPMFSTDGTTCIVYNGEVYNHPQLRLELMALGRSFQSRSDTEVVLQCYQQYGTGCLHHLHGMFSFAIWDDAKKILFVARDRLGEKPLYYSSGPHGFAFASEIGALLELPWISKELSPHAIHEYFALQYVPGPRTVFRNIFKLAPGHSLVVRDFGRTIEITSYWQLEETKEKAPGRVTSTRHIKELIENSVKACLLSDVEVGVLLSGGVDSSLLASIASKHSPRQIKTFSVGFRRTDLNELPFADSVAHMLGTDHYSLVADEVAADDFLNIQDHLGEPLGDPACIPTFLIARFASQHVKVVLSGEGADEVFGGYPYYLREKFLAPFLNIPHGIRSLAGITARYLPRSLRDARAITRIVHVISSQRDIGTVRWTRVFSQDDSERFYSRDLLDKVRGSDPLGSMKELFAVCTKEELVDKGMYIDLKSWLPDDLFMKVDKMTMAHSLEARAPYVDHKLVEAMYSLKLNRKIHGTTTKAILKELAVEYLPPGIVKRRKHGFEVPVLHWMHNNFRELAEETFDAGHLSETGLFNVQEVQREWQASKSGGYLANPRRLWLMFCFMSWALRSKRPW